MAHEKVTRSELVEMYKTLTTGEIADKLGMSYMGVYNWLVAYGIPRKKPGRPSRMIDDRVKA